MVRMASIKSTAQRLQTSDYVDGTVVSDAVSGKVYADYTDGKWILSFGETEEAVGIRMHADILYKDGMRVNPADGASRVWEVAA